MVDRWFSKDFQESSEKGKEARSQQSFRPVTGGYSFANMKHDFYEEHGRYPTRLEFMRLTHQRQDKTFAKGTDAEEFLEEASTKVQEIISSSPTPKDLAEVEEQVHLELYHGGQLPYRAVGYGRGVSASSVYGAHGLLSKKADGGLSQNTHSIQNVLVNVMEQNKKVMEENKELHMKQQETNQMLLGFLEAMDKDNGRVGPEVLDAVRAALDKQKRKVVEVDKEPTDCVTKRLRLTDQETRNDEDE